VHPALVGADRRRDIMFRLDRSRHGLVKLARMVGIAVHALLFP
jgi:hypothetical protein